MSSGGRLSRKQKGKAIVSESSPARDVDGTPLDDFELGSGQDHHRSTSLREGRSGRCERQDSSHQLRSDMLLPLRDFRGDVAFSSRITSFSQDEGPDVGKRPPDAIDCWERKKAFEGIQMSHSYFSYSFRRTEAVVATHWLPMRLGVVLPGQHEALVPDSSVGYFIREATGCRNKPVPEWLMAPRGSVNGHGCRNRRHVNVRAFEELTPVNPLDEGLWSIKMRPNYNVVKGYPNKTVDWQRSYFYIKSDDSAFEDLPDDNCDHLTSREYPKEFLSNARAIARLQPDCWGNVTRDMIRRVLDRISKRDWNSLYLPEINTVKRRISLFTRDEHRAINASRGMKGLPDLSAMMASQLGLPRPEPVNPPNEVGDTETAETTTTPARQDLLPVVTVTSAKKRGGRKRSRDDLAIHETREISPVGADAPCQENTDEPPTAKKRKRQPNDGPSPFTRKPRRTSEHGGSRPEASPGATSDTAVVPNIVGGPVLVTAGTFTGGVLVLKKVPRVVFPDRVSFEYDGPSPLIYIPHKCAELVSQIRGGPRSLPPVADLFFKDEYVDAARTKLLKLKEKLAAKGRFFRRKTAEWTAAYEEMVAKRERAIARRKIHQERANVAEADLRIANATISTLETKTGQLQEKIGLEAESHKEELARLRESRTFEVTKERVRVETEMIAKCNKHFANIHDYQTQRVPFDTMLLLKRQAFGTRKCLEALKASGHDIPQETIKMFAAQEKHFEEEALKLDVGEIPEADLTLSPLKLDSQLVDERVMVGLDPFGSNTNLIDARTALLLHTPSSPRGLHAGTSASPDRRLTDENAAFAPGGD
ncbi:hypothetical protein N665_1896s0004 [Sinapis alba]|nr:hypothetical protein N665_1896s0004 [Sinapis alba]